MYLDLHFLTKHVQPSASRRQKTVGEFRLIAVDVIFQEVVPMTSTSFICRIGTSSARDSWGNHGNKKRGCNSTVLLESKNGGFHNWGYPKIDGL